MNVTEIHSSIRLSSYYRWFVKGFANIASHLTYLTFREVPFKWDDKYKKRFEKLKAMLTSSLVLTLTLSVEDKDFIVLFYASHLGLGVMLI